MRVLLLTYETPAYPAGGGPGRVHALLEPLAARHQVRVVSTGGAPAFGRIPTGVDVQLVDAGPPFDPSGEPWLRKNLSHYVGGVPWLHRGLQADTEALAAALPKHLEEWRPDLIQVHHGELARLLPLLPPTVPRVLDLPDLLTAVQYQQARPRSLRPRVAAALERRLITRQERRDVEAFDATVVVSDADLVATRRLAPGARVEVVPNSIDTGYFTPAGERAAGPTAVMTASFHYPPNRSAALELLAAWPAVRRRVPGAALLLAGQRMAPELRAAADATDGVIVVADPADLRPQMWSAWIALAPLRLGAGSPLKVMESMAAGLPVVTVDRVSGALGVGEADGVVVAGDPPDYAAAIADLLGNPSRVASMSARAMASARARFDRQPASMALERVWEDVVERRG